MFALLVPVVLLTVHAAVVDCLQTYTYTDRVTGTQLECEFCHPGTYLRARCTATCKSDCAPCPSGSYTAHSNYMPRCLRCGSCGHYEVVHAPCTAHSDTKCACKKGFYYKEQYDTCMPHTTCPSGQGVLSKGTSHHDTICHVCSNGTFSVVASAHQSCSEQKSCDGAGQQLLLKSAPWHDSVCVSCSEVRDAASYLREILPAFFTHHSMSVKRLRRLVHNLLPKHGGKHGDASTLLELNALVSAWIASASDEHIRKLPDSFKRIGATAVGERLQNKLQRIDRDVKQLCG